MSILYVEASCIASLLNSKNKAWSKLRKKEKKQSIMQWKISPAAEEWSVSTTSSILRWLNTMQVLIWSLYHGMIVISSPQYLWDEASLMLEHWNIWDRQLSVFISEKAVSSYLLQGVTGNIVQSWLWPMAIRKCKLIYKPYNNTVTMVFSQDLKLMLLL